MTALAADRIAETVYRLDGPLRWALGEVDGLLREIGPCQGMTVVDLGAGTGYATIPAARAVGPDGTVIAVDGCRELLEILARKATAAHLPVRTVHADAAELPLPDAGADLALCTYVLHELADPAPALAELHRVLRPGGRLIVADYRKTEDERRNREIEAWYARQPDGAGPGERHLRYTLADMERMLLAAGFRHPRLSTWHDFHLHAIAVK